MTSNLASDELLTDLGSALLLLLLSTASLYFSHRAMKAVVSIHVRVFQKSQWPR